MKLWLLCALLGIVVGQGVDRKPHPCRSPPLLRGSLTVVTQSGNYSAYAKYAYDAIHQRILLKEIEHYKNETHAVDALLLYQKNVMYLINYKNKTCQKLNLTSQFHPLKIPCNATLLGQVVLGSKYGPGEGLLVNSWTGETSENQGRYVLTFTEYGCFPITVLFNTPQTGWISTNFFNNERGIRDPSVFKPPPFCNDTQDTDGEGDFYSVFH